MSWGAFVRGALVLGGTCPGGGSFDRAPHRTTWPMMTSFYGLAVHRDL
jgi:hypothetical protein